MQGRWIIGSVAVAGLLLAGQVSAASFTSPSEDRWMYPFSGSPGLENAASIFGAVGSDGFDDRDGQLVVEFDTASQIAAGQGAANYQITSARLTLYLKPEGQQGTWQYDSTYDGVDTYTGAATDGDAGRPLELFGAGYRNGFDTVSFLETSPFGSGPTEGTRNAFANDNAGGVTRDVSNNVAGNFEVSPFAIGTIAGLAEGANAPGGAEVIFDLDLTPDVLAYLQNRLDLGAVDLVLATLHASSFGGAATYPRIETKEGTAGFAPRLELDVTIVPEPGTALLLVAGLSGLAVAGRRRA